MKKQFTLAQVLSITTGRLTCEMEGVYDILNHVTGDNLYTHVLPRACRFARPLILEDHPQLAINEQQDTDLTCRIEEAKAIGGNIMDTIGTWLSLLELPMLIEIESHEDAWMSLDPMAELAEMVGEEKIVRVEV